MNEQQLKTARLVAETVNRLVRKLSPMERNHSVPKRGYQLTQVHSGKTHAASQPVSN